MLNVAFSSTLFTILNMKFWKKTKINNNKKTQNKPDTFTRMNSNSSTAEDYENNKNNNNKNSKMWLRMNHLKDVVERNDIKLDIQTKNEIKWEK